MKYLYLSLSLLFTAPAVVQAQSSKDFSVLVSADVQANAPKISLKWPLDTTATSYKIWRKSKTAATWGNVLATVPGTATSYTDNTTTEGQAYEYRVEKSAQLGSFPYTGNGYIYAGAKIPATENRDKIILLVDNDFTTPLATELKRLEMDLMGDGWQVIRHNVNKTDKVKDVKKIIMQDYNADPTHVKALFLLGHIPVPYAGNYAVDHHIPDHQGAWPADVYYGSMEENLWTDYLVDNEGANRTENRNIPDDGKFDNDVIPSEVKLQIGRVDFFNLPAFTSATETDLMRRYLNKDHGWRTKGFTAKEQGLIEDNFGGANGEAFAAVGFYNFAAMFGENNVFVKDYTKTLAADTFLWSYGAGGGSFTSVGGVVSTNDYVTKKVNTVFTLLFGSYSGDWDSENNILRSALAGDNMVLASAWAGRPHWNFHHMALGETIGYNTQLTQNDWVNYFRVKDGYHPPLQEEGDRLVTPALIGDPTLRMHIVAPAKISTIKGTSGTATVTWSKSPDAESYYVYRSTDLNKPFTRVAVVASTDSVYKDNTPLLVGGKNYYMVRALKLQTSASGTYYNLSQGSIDSVLVPVGIEENTFANNIQVYPNPSQTGAITLAFSQQQHFMQYTIQVTDITGRTVYAQKINSQQLQNGKITIHLNDVARGIYTLQVNAAETAYTQKLILK